MTLVAWVIFPIEFVIKKIDFVYSAPEDLDFIMGNP
jgi:hypothetical protein